MTISPPYEVLFIDSIIVKEFDPNVKTSQRPRRFAYHAVRLCSRVKNGNGCQTSTYYLNTYIHVCVYTYVYCTSIYHNI